MLLSESSDVINKLTWPRIRPVLVQIFTSCAHIFPSSVFTSVKFVLNEFPLKRGGLIGRPLQTDRWSGEWTSALTSSCGRDFLCYLKSGSVLKQSSSRLTQRRVRFCFCVARIMRAREGGAEGRVSWWGFGGFYYGGYSVLVILSWGSLMASSATITQWNTTTAVSSSHNRV